MSEHSPDDWSKRRKTIAEASDEQISMMSDASSDPYILHVTERVNGPEPIIHEAGIDWWEERRKHIMNKMPLNVDQADLAILGAQAIVRLEILDRGET